jgi:hypothetical protein
VGSIIGLVCSVGFYFLFEYLGSKGKLSEEAMKLLFIVGLFLAVVAIVVDLLF